MLCLSCVQPVWAGADKICNGDVLVARCSGNDKYAGGNHVMVSGTDTDYAVGRDECAAIVWRSGTPDKRQQDDDSGEVKLTDVEIHTDLIGPQGVWAPQPVTETLACWTVQPIERDEARPVKLPNPRKPFAVRCSKNPQDLQISLPSLIAIGQVSVDPKGQKMNFFGVTLNLVPHAGSAYLAVSKEFAVTLHKRSGAYKIMLPSSRELTGSCEMPVEKD